jgi:site-specific DNA-cytosine methylase
MKLLELFSGTGSVRKAVGERFSEIVSVDILPKFGATITTDILTWNYQVYPPHYFDIIWASPPCTEYSTAKTRAPRNLELADSIVQKTLEIINYFQPTTWYIENPQTGLLKSRPFMENIPFYDINYCQYGLPYKKSTRIWTNKENFQPKICNKLTCTFMNETRTRHNIQLGNGRRTTENISKINRYRIPDQLIKDLF